MERELQLGGLLVEFKYFVRCSPEEVLFSLFGQLEKLHVVGTLLQAQLRIIGTKHHFILSVGLHEVYELRWVIFRVVGGSVDVLAISKIKSEILPHSRASTPKLSSHRSMGILCALQQFLASGTSERSRRCMESACQAPKA